MLCALGDMDSPSFSLVFGMPLQPFRQDDQGMEKAAVVESTENCPHLVCVVTMTRVERGQIFIVPFF